MNDDETGDMPHMMPRFQACHYQPWREEVVSKLSAQAHEQAEDCGRKAINVAVFAASHLNGDAAAYWFSDEADELGLDPWAVIDGIDPHRADNSFDVWFASGKSLTVADDTEIFVSRKHWQELQGQDEKAIQSE